MSEPENFVQSLVFIYHGEITNRGRQLLQVVWDLNLQLEERTNHRYEAVATLTIGYACIEIGDIAVYDSETTIEIDEAEDEDVDPLTVERCWKAFKHELEQRQKAMPQLCQEWHFD